MAQSCAHCGSADTQAGFDRFQCLSCGGFTNYHGEKVVPTSALAPDANVFEGPGGELVTDPAGPPFKAVTGTEVTGSVPPEMSVTDQPAPVPVPPVLEEVSASGEVVEQGPQESPQG